MFRTIKKKEVLESLLRHKDVTPVFFQQIEDIPKEILENVGTNLAKKAVAMSQEVDRDLHSHKAFLRLSVSPHGILYAESDEMKHHNEIALLEFFQSRFPTFIILFKSKRGIFSLNKDNSVINMKKPLNEVLKKMEEKFPMNPLLVNLNGKNYQELWETFAQSQIIQGRGSSIQMTKLSRKWKRTVAEDKTSSKQLDEFFHS
ncbi:MAG: DUF4130 domain-containing protein [Candidatus Heimdallarchaeota archaeon]|nr:MAG: DUF4130 domain-containing protein [Candidatus Heimdallarchaeota archaeon]